MRIEEPISEERPYVDPASRWDAWVEMMFWSLVIGELWSRGCPWWAAAAVFCAGARMSWREWTA